MLAYDTILVLGLWAMGLHLQHSPQFIVKAVEYSFILTTFPRNLIVGIMSPHTMTVYHEMCIGISTLFIGPIFWALLGFEIHRLIQKK